MLLMGRFKYDKKVTNYFQIWKKKKKNSFEKDFGQNQRTLPFNVDILNLPLEKRIHMGSSSKKQQKHNLNSFVFLLFTSFCVSQAITVSTAFRSSSPDLLDLSFFRSVLLIKTAKENWELLLDWKTVPLQTQTIMIHAISG